MLIERNLQHLMNFRKLPANHRQKKFVNKSNLNQSKNNLHLKKSQLMFLFKSIKNKK